MKISVVQLRSQLAEFQKQETVAQTREQLLNDEKVKLLDDINALLVQLEKLSLLPKGDLTPQNVPMILEKLYEHIQNEVNECLLK